MNFNEIGIRKYIDLEKWGISSFGLKIIAAATMFIDHAAVVFAADNRIVYLIMRSIGRLSFPIFCFLLVEGFFYTRSRVKHLIYLFIFALVSEVPYDMFGGSVYDPTKQSAICTMLMGYIVIWAMDAVLTYKDKETGERKEKTGVFDKIMGFIIFCIGYLAASVINPTYTSAGIFLITFFYLFHGKHIGMIITNLLFNIGFYLPGIQWLGVFSIVPIELYNGKPGKRKWKYFFYIFYPVHLFILAIIKSKYLY